MSRAVAPIDPRRFLLRALLECYLEGDRLYWLRRADAFAAVGTVDCAEIALACRNRASLHGDSEQAFSEALTDLLGPGVAA